MLNALQINKKNCIFSTFPSSNPQNFEDSVSVTEFYQSIAVQLYQTMLKRWLLLMYVYK